MPSGNIRSNGMESCADLCFGSCRFAPAMAASILLRSALVRFRVVDNLIYLLVQPVLPFQHGIEIVRFIGPLLGTQEADPDDVAENLLQRLSVPLVHGEQEERQHHEHHDESGGACLRMRSENEKKRYADNCAAAKADELPFC